MGVFAIGVKTPPAPPGCGSFATPGEAIASPSYTESDSFSNPVYIDVDAGEYAAILYQGVGSGSAGFLVNFISSNQDDSAAAFSCYSYTQGGSLVTTVNSPDGVIEFGDDSMEIPTDAGDFYIVIYNSGGDSCDNFEFKLYDAS